jgi:hypothetical protein
MHLIILVFDFIILKSFDFKLMSVGLFIVIFLNAFNKLIKFGDLIVD